MIKLLMTLGALAVIAAVVLRSSPKAGRGSPGHAEAIGSAVLILPSPESPAISTIPDLIAALPPHFSLLEKSLHHLKALEAVVRSDPASARPLLLERYKAEKDPAYKGVLAVLLGLDSSTHATLIEDFQTWESEDADLFRGLALFALVMKEETTAWDDVVLAMEKGRNEILLARRLRYEGPKPEILRLIDEMKGIYRFTSETGESDFVVGCGPTRGSGKLTWDVGPSTSTEIRSLLLAAHGRVWEWKWINEVSLQALKETATSDREFAGTLVNSFLEDADLAKVETGLNYLTVAKIPEACVDTVIRVARSSLAHDAVFTRAVELLGAQVGAAVPPALLELYALNSNHDQYRDYILEAMTTNGNPAFEPVAWDALQSTQGHLRLEALRLLAKVNPSGSIDPLVQTLRKDPDENVRETALEIMFVANRWSSAEEAALAHAASHEVNVLIRGFARRLLEAELRSEVSRWGDPGEDESDPLDMSQVP